MQDKKELGKFILSKRKELNLSQKELAQKLYVTESAVSKWERGISYPDITMISGICEALQISERELVNASEDNQQRVIEKQAKGYKTIIRRYSIIWYVIYALTLIPCFIADLAGGGGLSWFFIVVASLMLAFSIFNVPVIAKKHKLVATITSVFVTLNLLIGVCNIVLDSDIFLMSFFSLLFSFVLLFLPVMFKDEMFNKLTGFKGLICMALDSILLYVLVIYGNKSADYTFDAIRESILIVSISIIIPWVFFIIIRYLKINGLFKTSICITLTGLYLMYANSIFATIIDKVKFKAPEFNLMSWEDRYLNGNVTLITLLSCLLFAICFAIGGIVKNVKASKNND